MFVKYFRKFKNRMLKRSCFLKKYANHQGVRSHLFGKKRDTPNI